MIMRVFTSSIEHGGWQYNTPSIVMMVDGGRQSSSSVLSIGTTVGIWILVASKDTVVESSTIPCWMILKEQFPLKSITLWVLLEFSIKKIYFRGIHTSSAKGNWNRLVECGSSIFSRDCSISSSTYVELLSTINFGNLPTGWQLVNSKVTRPEYEPIFITSTTVYNWNYELWITLLHLTYTRISFHQYSELEEFLDPMNCIYVTFAYQLVQK